MTEERIEIPVYSLHEIRLDKVEKALYQKLSKEIKRENWPTCQQIVRTMQGLGIV